MDDHNNIVARIKRVLDSHDIEDQKVINALILEALASNSQQLVNIRKEGKVHNTVHVKLSEEYSAKQKGSDQVHDDHADRIKSIERIIYFPSQHPKKFTVMLIALLFLLNLWFISGFRELFLRMLSAPDWLIQFLVPGVAP